MAAVTVFLSLLYCIVFIVCKGFHIDENPYFAQYRNRQAGGRSAGGMSFRLNKHVLLVKCGNSLCHFLILDVMAVFDLNRF